MDIDHTVLVPTYRNSSLLAHVSPPTRVSTFQRHTQPGSGTSSRTSRVRPSLPSPTTGSVTSLLSHPPLRHRLLCPSGLSSSPSGPFVAPTPRRHSDLSCSTFHRWTFSSVETLNFPKGSDSQEWNLFETSIARHRKVTRTSYRDGCVLTCVCAVDGKEVGRVSYVKGSRCMGVYWRVCAPCTGRR